MNYYTVTFYASFQARKAGHIKDVAAISWLHAIHIIKNEYGADAIIDCVVLNAYSNKVTVYYDRETIRLNQGLTSYA